MMFLVLLSALLACAAGKCYSYSNVILDGPDIQDLYMYEGCSESNAPLFFSLELFIQNV